MDVELAVFVLEAVVFVAEDVVEDTLEVEAPDDASVFPTILVAVMMLQTEFPDASVTQL